jgi:hypothetical protein
LSVWPCFKTHIKLVVCIRVSGQQKHLFYKANTQMHHFKVRPLQKPFVPSFAYFVSAYRIPKITVYSSSSASYYQQGLSIANPRVCYKLQDALTFFRSNLIFCGLSTHTKHTHKPWPIAIITPLCSVLAQAAMSFAPSPSPLQLSPPLPRQPLCHIHCSRCHCRSPLPSLLL